MTRKRITILGATGSIGRSALEVAARHPDRFDVVGLAGGGNDRLLAEQAAAFRPEVAALSDPAAAERLARAVGNGTAVRSGAEGLAEVAALPADLVIAGIVGAAGLLPTFAAVEAGNDVALANKEALVMAGPLLMAAAERHGVRLFPIDSEHSAIFQCLEGHRRRDLDHIVLTASGGPFRRTKAEALAAVTPAQATRHPNWDMGAKITVDSATLMNKGLEVIEAHWLFGLAPEAIRVVVHPESIVHSMVAFRDGSVIAQMGLPDMRTPIAYAMAYPERIPVDVAAPDFVKLGALTFEAPDTGRFPCLDLAYRAAIAGGTLPAVLNAANEVAVAAFLTGAVGFTDIPRLVEAALDRHADHAAAPVRDLEQVLAADASARRHVRGRVPAAAAAGGAAGPA
jgi:1-deoxy-D-xylulose-5-phosphate reductoisomerase